MLDEAELAAYVKERLAYFKVPSRWVIDTDAVAAHGDRQGSACRSDGPFRGEELMAYPPANYPLTPAGVEDYPVKVGSMLLTLVDPHKGFESAYNRWYERDHFYAGCMEGPWQIAGSRWVATREMKNLRWGSTAVADPIDAGLVRRDLLGRGRPPQGLGRLGAAAGGAALRRRPRFRRALACAHRDVRPRRRALPRCRPGAGGVALDHHYDAIVCVWLDGRDGLDAAALHERIAASDALRDALCRLGHRDRVVVDAAPGVPQLP